MLPVLIAFQEQVLIFRLHNLSWVILFIYLFISGYMFRPSNGRIQTVNNFSKLKLLFFFIFIFFLERDSFKLKALLLS